MTDRELMQKALEALEPYAILYGHIQQVVTALRERLAQPEPAPGYCKHCQQYTIEEPLPAQPEQEPVVWMYQDKSTHEVRFQKHMRGFVDHGATYETPLYTTPPRREWVGLTEEEQEALWDEAVDRQEHFCSQYGEFADAIEAKLKEKNA